MLARLLEPQVERHLLVDEGEIIVDEVRKHWAASIGWYLLLAASTPIFALMIPAGRFFWLPLAAGLAAFLTSIWKIHVVHMDRFVVTNMRVFRVHGVFNQMLATMPMTRILDISLHRPLAGQIWNYGHFTFESAAQDQGLRDIRFVGRPEERDLTIQRVIQRAGLRRTMRPSEKADADY
ncbi:PH domain-containing protein [Tessaracoccus oleiagri]|uniref:PH domain-containing protein n=1 Tax=Tessaracoccus oleiagri TaxID=686624 RepID=A0A1G9M0J5_9ACTN|nr:PH domain-containing protein [Tessaracoccus oleiagri]SDL67726.1 PH domain-containing protein [Tessaracoccus oleiagri]